VKRKLPIHLKALLILLVALFVFSAIVPMVSAAIPGQLYGWYVVTTIAVILIYVSSSEASWREFARPFRELLQGRTALTKPLRILVFILFPLLCGWYFSGWASGSAQPPGGLRVIHPTPPSSVTAFIMRIVSSVMAIALAAMVISPRGLIRRRLIFRIPAPLRS
jgi:hypothetical protein